MNFKGIAHQSSIILILILVIASCSQGRIQPEASFSFSPNVQYSILRDETNGIDRLSYVQMNESVEKSILESIAQEIVNREEVQFERTFILYYLPDMEIGDGAWALSETSSGDTWVDFHLSPRMEGDIRGTSPGPTEAELVETLTFLQDLLAERGMEWGEDHPGLDSYRNKIDEIEKLLARYRKEQ